MSVQSMGEMGNDFCPNFLQPFLEKIDRRSCKDGCRELIPVFHNPHRKFRLRAASEQIWRISLKQLRPRLNVEKSLVSSNPRGMLRVYARLFGVMDTVRPQLVRGKTEVRTCSCVGKLRLTDDWQQP